MCSLEKKASITAKPFLKWAGGKRQLLRRFQAMYPEQLKNGNIKTYYEPFLGSGAVFFDIAQRYNIEQAYLSDANKELVLTYQVLQSHPHLLIEALTEHQLAFVPLTKKARHIYYYEQRERFNAIVSKGLVLKKRDQAVERAARFIFLNRTCFNGLFRVNAAGLFNTPVGDYTSPVICDEENLLAASRVLSCATIELKEYKQALNKLANHAFVYLDPPYRPLSATASFTAYHHAEFGDAEQQRLAKMFRKADARGAALMLSNSDTADGFFDELYKGYSTARLPARRLINANAALRGPVNEIVVTNYPLPFK